MAKQSAYPPALDSLATDLATNDVLSASVWNTYMDGIYYLEDTVGITGSAVTHSMDYKLKSTSSLNPGHKHSNLWRNDFSAVEALSGGPTPQTIGMSNTPAVAPLVWPAAQAATGSYLANDGSGNLSWGGNIRARIYATAAFNITAAGQQICYLDTIDYESVVGVCNVTTHRITPGVVGYYYVIFVVECAAVADTEVLRGYLIKNGDIIARTNQIGSGVSAAQRVIGTDLVYLDADDYIELNATNTDTTNAAGVGIDSTSLTLFGPL